MSHYVYIATSLDGFIARKDGAIDWLTAIDNPEQTDYGYEEFISQIDAIVMGRSTYELAKKITPWPYKKPVYVMSRTLNEITSGNDVHLTRLQPKELVEQLHAQGLKNLYIDGGKTIQSFLNENLIDEMTITKIPLLLGGGIPLFDSHAGREIRFIHVETVVYKNGLVKSAYRKNNP